VTEKSPDQISVQSAIGKLDGLEKRPAGDAYANGQLFETQALD
jgi:hypothetical protein